MNRLVQNLQGIGNFSSVFSLACSTRNIFVWELPGRQSVGIPGAKDSLTSSSMLPHHKSDISESHERFSVAVFSLECE